MSVFLTSALHSLGMGATLIALSVVALDAWSRGATWLKAFAPVMHSGAALLVSHWFPNVIFPCSCPLFLPA